MLVFALGLFVFLLAVVFLLARAGGTIGDPDMGHVEEGPPTEPEDPDDDTIGTG